MHGRFFVFAVLAIAFALGCIASTCFGAEASASKRIVLRGTVDQVADFLKSHPEDVAKATKCVVVSRDGDTTRLRRETPKGPVEFTVREKIEKTGAGYSYTSELIESHDGKIEAQRVTASLTPSADGWSVLDFSMYVRTSRRGPVAFDVRAGVTASVRGFQNWIEREFR